MKIGNKRIRELIIKDHLVAGYIDLDKQVQPNGFDMTVKDIYIIDSSSPPCIDFDNSARKLPRWSQILPEPDGTFKLRGGMRYKVVLNEIVKLPLTMCAEAKPRSSLLRMGCTVHTAEWDAGYEGRSEVLLDVGQNGLIVKKDARIIQLVFGYVEECEKSYAGVFQGENIENKKEA